jgi:hypothetical protein
VELYTQYLYEKRWSKTTKEQALRMIQQEMPQADAEATLKYILEQLQKGKAITLGECRFKFAP